MNKVKTVGDEEQATKAKQYQQKSEVIDQFIKQTQNMFSQYYKRAAVFDKLDGLSDRSIKDMIGDSPSKIKKRSKVLRKQLDHHNIFLNEQGHVDYSRSSAHPNFLAKLKENPMVKLVLLQQDLEYEFPHKIQQQEQARQLRSQLESVQLDKQELIDANYQ